MASTHPSTQHDTRHRNSNIDACSLKMKNSLEGIIIKWACQINDVLKEDSSQAFKDGRHPTPVEEISFWESRQKNLRNIYAQLTEPKARQIGVILEGIDSVYSSSFKKTFKHVVQAVHEADDISLYLKPLVGHTTHLLCNHLYFIILLPFFVCVFLRFSA